jgi:hypothetical protein
MSNELESDGAMVANLETVARLMVLVTMRPRPSRQGKFDNPAVKITLQVSQIVRFLKISLLARVRLRVNAPA